jgi:hypothetical protein
MDERKCWRWFQYGKYPGGDTGYLNQADLATKGECMLNDALIVKPTTTTTKKKKIICPPLGIFFYLDVIVYSCGFIIGIIARTETISSNRASTNTTVFCFLHNKPPLGS